MPGKPFLYLYNGRVRIRARQSVPASPHLLCANGFVVHSDASLAPFDLDFRSPNFETARARHEAYVEFIDLEGATVLPGLCDAHVHFLWWSDTLLEVDLTAARNVDEALSLVRAGLAGTCRTKHSWLIGHGWSHNSWPGGHLPSAGLLDSATGDIPAILSSKCGHLAWANSAALRIGQVATAADPPGGSILRDGDGQPTGILAETAIDILRRHVPKPTPDDQHAAFLRGQSIAHSFGITSMHTPEDLGHFQRLQAYDAAGELKMRVQFLMPCAALPDMADLRILRGFGGKFLRVAGTKLFADGSLGGRTAAMIEPYIAAEACEHPYGIVVADRQEIARVTIESQKLGIPMAIHAIGDRAVRDVLHAYKDAHRTQDAQGAERLPHRIEHLQVIHPDDLDLLASVKPVASVQPVHLCADIDPILTHWGSERGRLAYAFKTAQDLGCRLIFGSDAPVEPISPWLGFFAANQRVDLNGRHQGGFHRQEALDAETIFEAYTEGPAKAAGVWPTHGNLLPGAVADFAVFDSDPLLFQPQQWKTLKAKATYVDQSKVWDASTVP